jgi:hypothetical protein
MRGLRTARRRSLVFSLYQPGAGGLSRCAALPGLRRAGMWLDGSQLESMQPQLERDTIVGSIPGKHFSEIWRRAHFPHSCFLRELGNLDKLRECYLHETS